MGDKKNDIVVFNNYEEAKKASKDYENAIDNSSKALSLNLSDTKKSINGINGEFIKLSQNIINYQQTMSISFSNTGNEISKLAEKSSEGIKNNSEEAEKSSNIFKTIAEKGKDIFSNIITSDTTKSIINFGKESINLASNLQEVQNIIDTAFPNEAESINKWAKNAINAFGMSEVEAKKFNITMADTLKSMGFSSGEAINMSQGIIGLAGD